MESIRAAHNLTIELYPTSWRLVNGSLDPVDPSRLASLFEATAEGITCSPAFARARQLPADKLAPEDVARVVVGWAPESSNWHLGILLANHPDSSGRVRWCGLASWPSGTTSDHMVQAKLAGQSLARMIDRPFHLVPAPAAPANPLSDTQSLQATERIDLSSLDDADDSASIVEIAEQAPPFTFVGWNFVAAPNGYLWQVRRKVLLTLFGRIVAFSAMTVLFVILGIGARTRGLAAVNPNWLPNLGLGVAVLMAMLVFYNWVRLLTTHDFVVDNARREFRRQGRFSRRITWRLPFDQLQYLVLTQSAATPLGRKGKDGPMRIAQDVWLHLFDGDQFREVVNLGHVEGVSHQWDVVRLLQKTPGRRHLHLAHYDTPAHHAVSLMAQAAEKPAWVDIR